MKNENEKNNNTSLLTDSKTEILNMSLIIEKLENDKNEFEKMLILLKNENLNLKNENIEMKKNENSKDLIIINLENKIIQNENEINNFNNILKIIKEKEINENIIKFH